MTLNEVTQAVADLPESADYVWDEKDEDERPATKKELKAAVKAYTNRGGRPRKEHPKQPVTIRLSPEVTAYFRATGRGWQTRMDEVLQEYVETHR